jgi:hypothetical protein
MKTFRELTVAVAIAAVAATTSVAVAAPQEIKGAAILEHPATKTAIANMSLMHAGKVEEAVKMGTKAMQKEWNALPAEDRKMMSEMMQTFAVADAEFRSQVLKFGVLSIDGGRATLVVQEEKKDENGSSTSTQTVRLQLEDGEWRVTKGD